MATDRTTDGLAIDDTLAVHAGEAPDPFTSALEPPVVMANAFAFSDAADAAAQFAGTRPGDIYSRWQNPTVRVFERKLAALERAEEAVAFASGMAAVHAAMTEGISAGDAIIVPASVYAETSRLARSRLARFSVEIRTVDTTDLGAVEAVWDARVRLLWIETPANPTLAISDIAALAALAHARGARLVCDSTFATPYHQKPLELGADLVVHAATKAIGGHGDSVGGVVAGSAERCRALRDEGVRQMGACMAPITAWLLSRGLRTLPLRAERAAANAMTLAQRLADDRRVAEVFYPGLPQHPGHAVARRQMARGFGAMVTFDVAGGLAAGRNLYDRVQLISRAVSLGDVRSLLTHAASTTHASLSREARRDAGIGEGLLRLSVGIESVEDLWTDLDRALG